LLRLARYSCRNAHRLAPPLIPPSVHAAFSSKADKNNLIPARVLDKQHRRMKRDPAYKDRMYETARAIMINWKRNPAGATRGRKIRCRARQLGPAAVEETS